MTLADRIVGIKHAFKAWRCKHAFSLAEMSARDFAGEVHWNCSKCGKPFVFDYGLQASDIGTIIK